MNKSLEFKIVFIRNFLKIIAFISVKWAAAYAFRLFITPFRKGSPYVQPVFEKGKDFNFVLDGIKLQGYCWNENSKKKILIVHGFESRSFNFYRYVEALIEKGIGVYAMDAKAHGNSEGKTVTLPEYIAMFRELENRVGAFDGYVCHSFGGIAVSLYEEQNNHPNSKMVLIAPATETATAIRLFCNFFSLSDKVRLAIYDHIESRSGKNISYYSIKRVLRKINNPVLWIHDQDDDITPLEDVREIMNEAPPNIHFHITKALGHRKIYKDPEIIKMVTDFL